MPVGSRVVQDKGNLLFKILLHYSEVDNYFSPGLDHLGKL